MLEIPAWSCLPRLLLQRLQCITFPESKLIQHARRMHSVYSYTMLYSNYTIHIMLYSVWNIRVLIFDTILVVPVLCCLPAKCSTWGGNMTCSMYLQCRRLWVSSRNMPYLGYLWLEGLYPVTSYHIRKMICVTRQETSPKSGIEDFGRPDHDCEGQDAEACWTDFKSSQNSTDLIASPGKTHGVTFRQRHISTATSRLGQELVGLSTSAGTNINTLWNTVVQTQQLPKKWKCHSKPMWERHISPCCRFPWRFGRKQSRRKATKVHLSYKKLSSHATTSGTVWAAGTIDVPLTSAYCSSWMLSWDSAGAEIPRLWDSRPLKVPHPAQGPMCVLEYHSFLMSETGDTCLLK